MASAAWSWADKFKETWRDSFGLQRYVGSFS